MKRYLVIILVICLFLSYFPPVNSIQITTSFLYVDDDNTMGPWDGSITYPFQFIQEGIDAAQPMDTIIILPGIYDENIQVYKQLRLHGIDKQHTIISSTNSLEFLILDSVNYTIITNLTFSCGHHERLNIIKMINCTYCTISNVNIISSSIQRSAIIVNGSSNTIEKNHITGRFIFSGIDLWYTNQNIIKNNTIKSTSAGIHLFRSHNNMVLDNTLNNNSKGIYIEEGNSNYICGNTLTGNNQGIFSTYSTKNTIERNDFFSNDEQAKFTKLMKKGFLTPNLWKNNYWDDYKWLIAKPIPGLYYIPNSYIIGFFIPWVEFDFFPSSNPLNL